MIPAGNMLRHPLLCLFQGYLRHVILHITERCSLRCKTCFVRKGGRDMHIEEARHIAGRLGKVRWLDIGGGEPFLHPGLADICRLFPNSDITIPTNGQDPDTIRDTARDLAAFFKGRLTLAVSIDGFESINDAIRGAGSYQNALQTLTLLREVPGLTLKVNTVISNANLPELTPFMRHIRALEPDYHSLLLVRGAPDDPAIALPPLKELEAATPEILDILGSYRFGNRPHSPMGMLKKRYQRYLWHINLKTLRTRRCWVPCKAPYLHRVVYPDGGISLCELMPPVGNLLEEPMDVLEKRMHEFLEQYERKQGPCFCTHNCNLGENIQTHPRSILAVLLGIDP
ncbi:MAG: Antilisterial bacteriocin subtilosin biosynthesis protein AlbA [Candidatus Hydrogenedentes bacterium ADurb.Bin101]|nr:MAG: Antilisterial bacteriocin subtilosin biosynthesis protein AlbA [Candidatus Hydrogenedentes bacterium ADurb.Bin101]